MKSNRKQQKWTYDQTGFAHVETDVKIWLILKNKEPNMTKSRKMCLTSAGGYFVFFFFAANFFTVSFPTNTPVTVFMY